jgi:hypothetical protein
MPASLFPTSAKWGDVVTVQGNFAGLHQGEVVVRFAGVPAQAIALTSAYGGSVVVPEGAQTGACQVEVQGRQVFGTNCTISKGLSGGPLPAQAPEHASAQAWKDFGPGTALLGLGGNMPYYADSYEGVGAIAASKPAPRSAPAPTAVRIAGSPTARVISGVPTIARPSRTLQRVYPKVGVRKVGPTRAPVILSGKRTAAQLGIAPKPTLTAAPPRRQPTVQIGTGIGTPRIDVLAPADSAWSRYRDRQAGIPLTRTEGKYAGPVKPAIVGAKFTTGLTATELEPLVAEAQVLETTPAPKPGMSTTTKLLLGAGAAAALYFLVLRKR